MTERTVKSIEELATRDERTARTKKSDGFRERVSQGQFYWKDLRKGGGYGEKTASWAIACAAG